MAIKSLKYNGVSTKDLGLVIQAVPSFSYPEKDVEITHVPGRNGDIVIDKGTYKNITKTYNLAMIFTNEGNSIFPWNDSYLANSLRDVTDFNTRARAVAKWLLNTSGYKELEDEYEPNIYRKAIVYNSNEISNVFNQGAGFDVTFECKPQKYLITGKQIRKFNGNLDYYFIIPNSGYYSSPHIKINSINNKTLNGSKIDVYGKSPMASEAAKKYFSIIIDSETPDINSLVLDWETKSITDVNGNLLYSRVHFVDSENNILYDFPEVPTDVYVSLEVTKETDPDFVVNGEYTPNWWSIW